MSVPRKYLIAATGLLLVVLSNNARAQINLPFGPGYVENDFQMFAPLELDLDNVPEHDRYGYYFSYDKLWWSITGERTTVGDPDVQVLSEIIYADNSIDNLDPPDPYVIKNGLQNVNPKAAFAFGDRYEFGYVDGCYGWQIGILDGPDLYETTTYGLGNTPPPGIDPNYLNTEGDGPGTVAGGDLKAFGFGNTHVNFAAPPGFLLGFRDYLNYLAGATIGTQGGPLLYVGNYGAVLEDIEDNQITVFRITDDINENGIPGAVVVLVAGPDGVLRPTTLTDFGDLHEFNIAFDSVLVHTVTKVDGVEAMWTQVLTNQHYMAKNQNNHLEFSYGARFLRLKDVFDVSATGSILGDSFWNTSFDNQIVGPQVAMKWINQRGRWTLTANAKFLFGYNVQDWSQENGIGTQLIPGATNRLLYGQPTYSTYGLQKQEFSPVGELRVEMAYHVTKSVALKAAYNGTYVGNVRRAAQSVRYYLPDMGYHEGGTQDVLINGLSFGAEFGY